MTSYHAHAIAFLRKFPIGSIISHDELDNWAIRRDLLSAPRSRTPGTDAWLAHLQKRHQLRYALNYAATDKSMLDAGETTFSIDRIGSDRYEVRRAHVALIGNDAAQKLYSLVRTRTRRLVRLLKSIEQHDLPPWTKMYFESIIADSENFKTRVQMEANILNDRYNKVASDFQKMIDQRLIPGLEDRLTEMVLPMNTEKITFENDNGDDDDEG